MDAIVVLAVALALLSVVAVVLAARVLLRQAGRLGAQVKTSAAGIQPLLDELSAETAVSAVELDALRRRAAREGRQPPLH